MTKLNQALLHVTKLGFDTAPVIYFIEVNQQYDSLVTEVFQRVSNGIFQGITAAITLTEVLIHPLRRGDAALHQQYSDLLLNAANFRTLPIDITSATKRPTCAPVTTFAPLMPCSLLPQLPPAARPS